MGQPLKIDSFDQALDAVQADPKIRKEQKRTSGKVFVPLAKSVITAQVTDSTSLNAWLFLNSPYKYHWYCAGIGTGKSYILSRYMLTRVITNWETVGMVAANTYTQLSQSTLPHLFTLLDEAGLEYVVDKRPPAKWKSRNLFKKSYENVISIKVGVGKVAHILTRTLEAWKAIRGVTIGWAALDEIADTRPEAWAEITERLRCELSHALQIRVVGMPALPGDNWTWREFNTKDPEARKNYRITFQSSTEARHLSWDKYLLPLLQRLDPMTALQRIHGRIVIDQTGRVYRAYADRKNNIKKYKYDPTKTLYLCWDFNILSKAPICVVLFQEHWNFTHKCWEIQVLDEIVIHNGDTPTACAEFLRRSLDGHRYEHHRGQIWVFGDVTSNLNRTTTEFVHIRKWLRPTFLARLQIKQMSDKSNPREVFRVDAMNGMLCNSFGVRRMFIDPDRCPETIEDCLVLTPKDGSIDKSDRERSHCTDALGYGVCIRFPPYKTAKAKAVKGNM